MAKRAKPGETSDKRNVVNVPLLPESNRAINEWCERTGGSKTTFVGRLIEFYTAAPESMQRVMLRDVPADVTAPLAAPRSGHVGA